MVRRLVSGVVMPSFGICVAALILVLPRSVATFAAEQSGARVLEEFTVTASGDELLIVPITVDGKRLSALLDTGTKTTMFNASLRHLLGPPRGKVTVETPIAQTTFETFVAPKITVGRLEPGASPDVIGLSDFSDFQRFSNTKFDACLGMDVLKNVTLQLDLGRGKVRILSSAPKRADAVIPLRMERGIPEIYISPFDWPKGTHLRGGSWFIVDTGYLSATDGDLGRDLFELFQQRGVIVKLGDGSGHDLERASKAPYGRLLATIKLGAEDRIHPAFFCGKHDTFALRTFASQIVTFDFPSRKVYFELPESPRVRKPKKNEFRNIQILRPNSPRRETQMREDHAMRAGQLKPRTREGASRDSRRNNVAGPKEKKGETR